MDIYLKAREFGIPDADPRDPDEVAIELLDSDYREALALVGQIGKAMGAVFHVKTRYAAQVLSDATVCLTQVAEDGNGASHGFGPDELAAFAAERTWVVLDTGLSGYADDTEMHPKLLFAMDEPDKLQRDSFLHVVKLRFAGDGSLIVEVDGQLKAALDVTVREGKFMSGLRRTLAAVADSPKGASVSTTRVSVPDTLKGATTFTAEADWVRSLITARDRGYRPPSGSTESQILKILINHCDTSVQLGSSARANLETVIRRSTLQRRPIPITLTIAHGMRVPHPWKNADRFGPPTAGWLYNLFEFMRIDSEVRRVYEPGVVFYILEEGPLFCDMLGVPRTVVDRNLRMFQRMVDELKAPVVTLPMLPAYFPPVEVAAISAPATDEEIFAILCSDSEMMDRSVMDLLYTQRNKPWSEIRRKVGSLWGKAAEVAERKNQLLAYRKKVGLFPRLVSEHCGGQPMADRLVDGAITEKDGRICFRMTAWAMFNHGAAVLERDETGRVVCHVWPEYRLQAGTVRFPGEVRTRKVRPVRMNPADLGEPGDHFVWCYEFTA